MSLRRLTSAIARVTPRRATSLLPRHPAAGPIPLMRPQMLIDGRKTVTATNEYRTRVAEVELDALRNPLPPWAVRVEVPAFFDELEVDTVLKRLIDHPSITRLVIRRPPSEETELRGLGHLRQLIELRFEYDFTYSHPSDFRLRLPWLARSRATDLRPLEGLLRLQGLTLAGNHDISDLGPLAHLTALRDLQLSGRITDLRPLRNLRDLQRLTIHHRGLKNLEPLAGLSELQALDVSGSKVRDLSSLSALVHLHSLDLSGTRVVDLRPLSRLPQLETLDLTLTHVSDLRPLAGSTRLRSLSLNQTAVADLTPLRACEQLETLTLRHTGISDLGPLAALPHLRHLSVIGTKIQHSQLRELRLPSTRVDGLTIVPAIAELADARPSLGGASRARVAF